ncbi:MAG: PEGA domain-containing protein [Deltaproteobacteria bacterium]|nr:PEGA domain-containing protein [Deltaproteobacteria bacterium]
MNQHKHPRDSEPSLGGSESSPRGVGWSTAVVAMLILGIAILFLVRALTHDNAQPSNVYGSGKQDFSDYYIDPSQPHELIFNSDPFQAATPHIVLREPLTASFKPKPKGRRAHMRRVVTPSHASPSAAASLPVPTRGTPDNNTGGRKYPSDPPPEQLAPVLRVVSVPSGLPVTVNGEPAGTTPIARRISREPSSWTVAIRAIGYAPFEQDARPGADGDVFVRAVLKEDPRSSDSQEKATTITEAAFRDLKRGR